MAFTRRKWIKPCFGFNPKTGGRVASRHRWPEGWGVGYCKFCQRTLEELVEVVRVYDSGRIVRER